MHCDWRTLGLLFLLGACLGVCLYHYPMPGMLRNQQSHNNEAIPHGQVLTRKRAGRGRGEVLPKKRKESVESPVETFRPYRRTDESGRPGYNGKKFECPVNWEEPGGSEETFDIEAQFNFLQKHFCWWCKPDKTPTGIWKREKGIWDAQRMSRRRMLDKKWAGWNTVVFGHGVGGQDVVNWTSANWTQYDRPIKDVDNQVETLCTHDSFLMTYSCQIDMTKPRNPKNVEEKLTPQKKDRCWLIGYCKTFHSPHYFNMPRDTMRGHMNNTAECYIDITPKQAKALPKDEVTEFDKKYYRGPRLMELWPVLNSEP